MKIISFSGLDKSGKHTQSSLLFDYLSDKGYKVYKHSFPSYETSIGGLIRSYLYQEEDFDRYAVELLFASDKYAFMSKIRELEDKGYDFLILDRYIECQMAYAGANGVSMIWLTSVLSMLPKSDLNIYLDIPPHVSISRVGKYDVDRYEKDIAFLSVVRKNYLVLCKNVVDGDRPQDLVFDEVRYYLDKFLWRVRRELCPLRF